MLKFIWKCKSSRVAKIGINGSTLLDIKTYSKKKCNFNIMMGRYNINKTKQSGDVYIYRSNFQQKFQGKSAGKRSSFQRMVLEQLDAHMQKIMSFFLALYCIQRLT